MGWLKRWGWLWPVATTAIMVPFGADPVMVYLVGWEYPQRTIYLVGLAVGTAELMYWNWIFGWGQAHIKEIGAVREAVEAAVHNFQLAGMPEEVRHLWGRAKTLFHEIWNLFLDFISQRLHISDPTRDKFMDVLLGYIKRTSRIVSYGLIFGIGTTPMIGGALGIALCRALPWRGTFIVLVTGNAVKILVIAWMLVQFVSPPMAKICLVGYGVFMLLSLFYLVRKQRKFKNRRA